MSTSLLTSLCLLALAGLATVSAHTSGTDPFVYFDAYLSSGDKCAQQKPVTGWTVDQRYRDATGARGTDPFTTSTGLFVTPVAGVYHCCASFRCKQNGYCDFSILRNNGNDVRLGTAGTRNTGINSNGWSSHGVCITNRAGAGVTYKVYWESTASSDCIEETDWRYGHFTCFWVSPL